MRISVSGSLLGSGTGFFGRLIIAFIILIVLKTKNKENKELDRGIKLLAVLGIAAILLFATLLIVWVVLFGAPWLYLPFGHYYH